MKSLHSNINDEFKPSQLHKENVIVGKDNDGLIASISLETCVSLPEKAKKVINSKEGNGYDEMINACTELMVHIYRTSPARLKNINCPDLNLIFNNKNHLDEESLYDSIDLVVRNNFNIENFGAGRAYDCYLAFKLNTPRHNFEALSSQWLAITNKYYMPTQLAISYRETVREEKNMIGFRLDLGSNTKLERLSAAKPAYIWLKLSNWGVFKNHIPVDQVHFGKTNLQGDVVPGVHTKETINPDKYPEKIKIKSMRYSLQELIDGLKDGTFAVDEKHTNDHRIAFRCASGINGNPKECKTIFSISMNAESRYPITEEKLIAESTQQYLDYLKSSQMLKWNEKWGTVENITNFEFDLQSNIDGVGDKFKNIDEFVIPLKDNPKKQHVFKPVQHSFENFNPYVQSNVNSLSILTGPDGIPFVTQDFKGVAKYLLEYCSDQVMHVNPKWNLSYSQGGQVVENQIKLVADYLTNDNLTVPIEASTIAAYAIQLVKDQMPYNSDLFEKLVQITSKLGREGIDARIQVCNYLTYQTEAVGHVPCSRELLKKVMNMLTRDAGSHHRLDPNPPADALSLFTDATVRVRMIRDQKMNKTTTISENKQESTRNRDESNIDNKEDNYEPKKYN